MIIEDYGGSHGVRDEERLRSLVEAPQMLAFGVERYETVYEKAAVYMRNCIADHIFVDGNKRTGTTLAALFLIRSGRQLAATPQELEDFAVDVVVKRLSVDEITEWLMCHARMKDGVERFDK